MSRKKGSKNTPETIVKQIIEEHRKGKSVKQLSKEYEKPYKTIKNMITRENNKKRKKEAGEAIHKKGRPSSAYCVI